MKVVADVQVNHRLTSSYNMPRRRSQRSTLSFTAKTGPTGKKDELYLIHHTQNGATMYKVKNNLEKVFDRFSNEGKMTIQFKVPPHDLNITSDQPLSAFVNALKMGYRGVAPVQIVKLTTFSKEIAKKVPPKPKTHLTYLSKSEYPYTEGFPRSAISITINGVEQKKIDMRLLGLQNLKVLDLGDNCLCTIPLEIDLLTSLTTLSLHHNNLGNASPFAWQWLEGDNIRKNLEELDLSHNKLHFLSPAVCHLRSLKVLKVSNNNLKILPGAIGTLPSFRTLMAACNKIEFLPGSICMLKLWCLDVSGNPLVDNMDNANNVLEPLMPQNKVPTLLEWAARTTVNNRLNYSPADLPLVVRQYLDTVCFCQCRQACFEASKRVYSVRSMSSLAQMVTRNFGDVEDLPLQFKLCSKKCMVSKLHSG